MRDSLSGRFWRPLAAGYLIIVEPVWMALVADAALARLFVYGVPAFVLLIARVAVTALGMAVGRAISRGDPESAALLGRTWALASLAASLVTWLTPYFPSNRLPAERRLALAATCVWYGAWLIAFIHRRHARKT